MTDIEGYLINDPTIIASYENPVSDFENMDDSVWVWFGILMFFSVFNAVFVGIVGKKKRLNYLISSNIFLFGLGIALTTTLLAFIVLGFSLLMSLAAMSGAGGGGGGSSSSSSGSSWWSSGSGGSSWGSSSGGGSFGGGSFGGGGSGGRW